MNPRRLFIAGATGAVGKVVTAMADRKGIDVVLHVRPKSASKLTHPKAVVMELDDPGLAAAMKGCTTVLQLIGTVRARFAAGDTYETSDIGTTRLLLEAAKTAGVDHFVLLSSVGAGRPMGAYLKAKAKTEQLVRDSELSFTILRPSSFEDREGKKIPAMRAITRLFGLKGLEPISMDELGSAILHVATTRGPRGVVLEGQSLWDAVAAALA